MLYQQPNRSRKQGNSRKAALYILIKRLCFLYCNFGLVVIK